MTQDRKEVESFAKQHLGNTARLFPYKSKMGSDSENWWALAVSGKIIGMRRQLSEIQSLAERGPIEKEMLPAPQRPVTAAQASEAEASVEFGLSG
ncbi:hypothetical protein [Bythopirellula goksoeyrii]|uniref:Uncharacterized protein n=1 Tax=Bythopirellula goksoeyrii TaxID=1400387 RepID=A0A5B9QAM0_9BACT|nr:hypothetical protein [Bythopirellula goksoeyrii]QEG35928.1 hypothetical protein Pr1d_32360 [Bythopirellula goksoeyrii]